MSGRWDLRSGVRAAGESPYTELFRNRNYLRVFAAGLGSVAGSAVTGVCLIWIVAVDTGSALDVALLGASFVVAAVVFSTLGGALVDRYDRRRLMILSDAARAVAMAAVVGDLALVGFNLPILIVAYGVVGAFTVLFNPAEQAIVPALVPAAQVADANGLVRSSRSVLQFLGISVAGVLIVTVGPLWGVAINALTFLASALLLTGLEVPVVKVLTDRAAVRGSYRSELGEGFRWLWQARGFFQLTMSAMFFNFSSAIVGTFLVFYATDVLRGSALLFAALLAAEVVGTALGSLLVGRVGAVRYAGKAWVVPYGIVSGFVADRKSVV